MTQLMNVADGSWWMFWVDDSGLDGDSRDQILGYQQNRRPLVPSYEMMLILMMTIGMWMFKKHRERSCFHCFDNLRKK